MKPIVQHLLLADDDTDDCLLFEDALTELNIITKFSVVHDGEQLMQRLNLENEPLPEIIFLDLNMPRKNGFECLAELKRNEKLKNIPVIIFSTSLDWNIVNELYKSGAYHYIRKPNNFDKLKQMITQALHATAKKPLPPVALENFLLVS